MDLRAQPLCLIVETPAAAARDEKIHADRITLGPEPQHLHQPSLRTAHAEGVDNLEDPDWALLIHVWSSRSRLSARSIFIGDALRAASAAARDGTGSCRSSIAVFAHSLAPSESASRRKQAVESNGSPRMPRDRTILRPANCASTTASPNPSAGCSGWGRMNQSLQLMISGRSFRQPSTRTECSTPSPRARAN